MNRIQPVPVFRHYLAAILLGLCLSALPARADDTPAGNGNNGTTTVTQTEKPADPAPGNNSQSGQGKTHARKEEEEEETATAPGAGDENSHSASTGSESASPGLFAKLFGNAGKKKAAAASAENQSLQARVDTLTAQVATLRQEKATLQTQVDTFNAELPAIETALQAGDSAAPALQTPFGQRIAGLVAHGITAAHARSGHDPAKLPGPGAKAPDTGKGKTSSSPGGGSSVLPTETAAKEAVPGTKAFKQVSDNYWASRMPAPSSN